MQSSTKNYKKDPKDKLAFLNYSTSFQRSGSYFTAREAIIILNFKP